MNAKTEKNPRGAGQPKLPYRTKSKRIPLDLFPAVDLLIAQYKKKRKEQAKSTVRSVDKIHRVI